MREGIAGRGAAPADFGSLEQAAQWYAVLRGEGATALDRQRWQAWLGERPENARAWQHIESVSSRFEPLRPGGRDAAMAGTKAARKRALNRRQAMGLSGGAAGMLLAGLAGWAAWRCTPLSGWVLALGADHHTATGEQRELRLADGSRVWLNTDTALDVDDQGDMRRLSLRAGEILVETASDGRQRPFFVDTRNGRMQALGTRFAVRVGDASTRLDVFEGAVSIRTAAGAALRVEAGRRASFDAGAISPVAPADRAREAWRRGVVLADNLPLAALVEELGRYRRGHIGVAPEVAALSVMGVYPAHDTDRALAMLEHTLPIRVQRTLPWWTTLVAR
uniref:FecR domain-containing protein n=1 Tax=unclassified Variovorax TaxID=663243 RepID=UPI000D37050B